MTIWEHSESHRLLDSLLKQRKVRGAGQRLAQAMQVHPSLVSLVLKGHRLLTLDQAEAAAHFLGLSPLESEYFLSLVERERAGSPRLRKRFDERLRDIRRKALEVRTHLAQNRELTDPEKSRFYSSGAYSAVRLATSLPRGRTVDGLGELLGLARAQVADIVEFLEAKGLVERDAKGLLRLGPARVHVPSTSPFVVNHHRNWRARANVRLETLSEEELAFTSPMTLSVKDVPRVKAILLEAVGKIREVVEASDPEILTAVTIDLWKV